MHAEGFFFQAFVYLAAAVVSVPIAKRLGLGSVLGYLIAGMVIGPFVHRVGGRRGPGRHAFRRIRRRDDAVPDRPGAAAEPPVAHAGLDPRAGRAASRRHRAVVRRSLWPRA